MKISEQVRTAITQDGAVLMNIKGGNMLTLNPVGSIIWQELRDGRAPSQIAAQLAADFGISQERASADVNEFLEKLEAQQVIESREVLKPRTFFGSKPARLFRNLFRWRTS